MYSLILLEYFGNCFQITRSSPQVVHLRTTHWTTAGNFRCEVTAEDFETASKSVKAMAVGKFPSSEATSCFVGCAIKVTKLNYLMKAFADRVGLVHSLGNLTLNQWPSSLYSEANLQKLK